MKLRTILTLFTVVAAMACGGAVEEQAAEPGPEAASEEAPMDDAAVIAALADEFVVHYNLAHASMVNDYFTEDAIVLSANGSVLMDAEGRLANLEAEMSTNPTLTVDTDDVSVFGDVAAAHGTYSIAAAPEGMDPTSFSGSWMAEYEKADADWKLSVLLTNYDADPPEGRPDPVVPAEIPPDVEDSALAELLGYYQTHFNMAHGGMVASRYAEDAVAAFAGGPKLEGRAAIEENLNARMEELGTPQLTIHVVEANEVGDGFVLGGGWYELAAEAGDSQGSFMVLARPGDDGNLQIQWAASNGLPVEQ